MRDKVPVDRKHELRMTVLGFVLTTVAGGLITWWFQHYEDNRKLEEDRRASATLVFTELSRLIDKRLYLWRETVWALEKDGNDPKVDAARRAHHLIVEEWNFSVNRNRALVCRYFGPSAGRTFEESIMPVFRELLTGLSKQLEADRPDQADLSALEAKADALNITIYHFNNTLAETLRSGVIGSTDPQNKCDFKPPPKPPRIQ